jgi:hypothetical protein
MYKLNLGVGFSIFKLVYLPYNDKTFILEIIKQHKLILSDKIINYYLEMAGEENSDIVESFLDALIYNDESHVYYKTNSEISAKDELIRLVEQNPMRVLVAEDEEFKDFTINKIKLISSKDIVEKKVNSLFRYSFPIVNYYVDVGEKCESYARWFGHLFENENVIQIIDKYILTKKGIDVLKKYYFPVIQNDTAVEIYSECLDEYDENMIINMFQDIYFTQWNISIYICTGMHDRYILFGKYQMSIGAGLDFLHISGTTKKACIINITYGEKKIPLPRVDHLLL